MSENLDFNAMIGTVRTDRKHPEPLQYRVQGVKRKGASRWTGPTVTVWGRCIEDKMQDGHANATWYGAYCAEVFHV